MMGIYAVTGKPVAHSLSPRIFNYCFQKEGINAVYTRLGADSADEALGMAWQIGLRGLNITAPFKEDMAGLMDELDPEARDIGAVNGVILQGGRRRGFNSDPQGVTGALAADGVDAGGKEAVVLGAGGAARAAVYALLKAGAKVTVVNRTYPKASEISRKFGCRSQPLENLQRTLSRAQLVLSAVSAEEPLIEPEWLTEGQIVLDAGYRNSPLSEIARKRGCRVIGGTNWLISQAVPAFELFTGRRLTAQYPGDIQLSGETGFPHASSISLVGMMATGKSTVGQMLAAELGFEWIDTDRACEEEAGASIPAIFRERGEEFFRKLEKQVLRRLGSDGRKRIYALGGGALSDRENRDIVKKRSFVIWLWAEEKQILERLPEEGRPLLTVGDRKKRLSELMSARLSDYALASDLVLNAARPPAVIVRKIIDEIH